MHSATLDTAAAILLLSSLASMGLLAKRTPRSRLASPTSILSASDVLSSAVTALMVFFHRVYVNDGSGVGDRAVDSTRDFAGHGGTGLGVNGTVSEDGAVGGECDLKSVLFQYSLFAVPFVNAFLSLLNFSINCYSNAKELDKRCCKLICGQVDTEKNGGEEEDHSDSAEASIGKLAQAKLRVAARRLTRSRAYRQRYRGLSLASQWLLPALFTGAFQLGERPRVDAVPAEELLCVVAANFPFESCAPEDREHAAIPSTVHSYVSSEDELLGPHPNSSEVDEVLRRVLGVVRAALNETRGVEDGLGYLNETRLVGDGEEVLARANWTRRRMDELEVEGGESADYSKGYLGSEVKRSERVVVAGCVKNRCVVSVRFLRIYMFVLLVLMYFVPILVSSLLLVVSYYKCREANRKVEEAKVVEENAVKNEEEDAGDGESRDGWFAAKTEEAQQAEEAVDPPASKGPSGAEETMCELACEAAKARGFFGIFKVNAACALLLWTPFFLQIISKVFFCSRVPGWLTEATFLATVAFAGLRNAVNLSIVGMEADAENQKKRNSVHPGTAGDN